MEFDTVVIDDVRELSACSESSHIGEVSLSSSLRNRSSANAHSSLADSPKYTSKGIEMLMKRESHRYVVVENEKCRTSKCWESFGFPAVIESVGEPPKIIEKFVSCRNCFATYSFNSNSTRLLNNHTCDTSNRTRSSSASASSSPSTKYIQTNLSSYRASVAVKINDTQIKRMKDLQSQWICKDIRPFTIIEDEGFRELAQELVSIG